MPWVRRKTKNSQRSRAAGVALAALAGVLTTTVVQAQSAAERSAPPLSATKIMPGCRGVGTQAVIDDSVVNYMAGFCTGAVAALLAPSNTRDLGYCVPAGVTLGQARNVAIDYIDHNPARQHEPFGALVLDAFRAAWPCRSS